jgi:hypothetical protein
MIVKTIAWHPRGCCRPSAGAAPRVASAFGPRGDTLPGGCPCVPTGIASPASSVSPLNRAAAPCTAAINRDDVSVEAAGCGAGWLPDFGGGQDWHVVSTNPTHRTRLARALADATGISYQKALTLVADAADAGVLPGRLNPAGMRRALELLQRHAAGAGTSSQGTLKPRYYRLAQVTCSRLQQGVPQRVARATAAAVPAARSWGGYGPAEIDVEVMPGDGDTGSCWCPYRSK